MARTRRSSGFRAAPAAERCEVDLAALRKRSVLCYSGRAAHPRGPTGTWCAGASRATSARPGRWRASRAAAARAMSRALEASHWKAAGGALAEEMRHRRPFPAGGVGSGRGAPARGLAAGAWGGKVCGAGGGGCLVFLPRPPDGRRGGGALGARARCWSLTTPRRREGTLRGPAFDTETDRREFPSGGAREPAEASAGGARERSRRSKATSRDVRMQTSVRETQYTKLIFPLTRAFPSMPSRRP